MEKVYLQSKDLLEVANRIETSSEKIDNALLKLDATMQDLDSVWSDQNSKKYLERYNELREEFPKFKQAVKSYGNFLNSVVNIYQKEFMDETSTSVNG